MEYDIVVIGGGPAGLSAAVRAAWVAAPGATYKARVLVLDAGDAPGGLSRWQPLVINSPSVIFTKRELKAMLRACDLFNVDMRSERVRSVRVDANGGFEIATATTHYQASAIVAATGCRLGHPGEHRLFHHGQVAWFHSHAMLDELMARFDSNDAIRTVCLCGTQAVAATRRYLGRIRRLEMRTFAEPPYTGPSEPDVERGRLDALSLDSESHRLHLSFVTESGDREEFASDVLLIDFNAYEKTATTLGIFETALRRQPNCFLDPIRDMSCGMPGVFSAGDVNGAPFSVAKAMSEGTIAGFGAYAYVCNLQTGVVPNLFPFYPYEI